MTNKEMDQKIRAAFTEATPDVLGSVLADCKKQPKSAIQFSSPMANWGKKFTLTVAAAALVICLSLGWNWGLFGGEPTAPSGPLQSGTDPSTHPTEHDSTNPTSVSLSVDMDMTASWLNEDGTVAENLSMTVNGTIDIKDDYPTYLNLNITLPQDFPYIFKTPELNEYITVDRWAYWPGDFASVCYCYNANGNASEMVAWAVNTEKEYFIACWKNEPGRYLVASVDPEVKPAEILEHFVLFADLDMPYDPEPTEPEPTDPQPTDPMPSEPVTPEPPLEIPDEFPVDLVTDEAVLAVFQEFFDTNIWARQANRIHFDDPRNMNLHAFFYGAGMEEDIPVTEEDRAAIVAMTGVEIYYERKAYCLSTEKMDQVLKATFGIPFSEMSGFANLYYLESSGNYCYFHDSYPAVAKVRVMGIRTLESGNMEVYYRNEREDEDYPKYYGVMTLKAAEGGYRIISNQDIDVWPEPGHVPEIPEGAPADLNTDAAVVKKFQKLFDNDSWYTQALFMEFDDPRSSRLNDFLFCDLMNWPYENATREEEEAVRMQLGITEIPDWWGDWYSMDPATIDKVLQTVFGLTLADFSESALEHIPFLESTGRYYYGRTDSSLVRDVSVRGIRELENGNIEVYYTCPYAGTDEGVVTLKPAGDSYIVISNAAL